MRYYLSGVLRNPPTALRQGRGTLGSRQMGESNGTEIRANPMHRGSEAPISRTAIKRPRSTWCANFSAIQPAGHQVT
jgi:hypothetical protein